jgi:hypothetical protein
MDNGFSIASAVDFREIVVVEYPALPCFATCRKGDGDITRRDTRPLVPRILNRSNDIIVQTDIEWRNGFGRSTKVIARI